MSRGWGLKRDKGTNTDYDKQQAMCGHTKAKHNASLTLVSVLKQSLIDVMLSGVFQDVEETQVDRVWLFHDDVQQRLSGLNWTICHRLD